MNFNALTCIFLRFEIIICEVSLTLRDSLFIDLERLTNFLSAVDNITPRWKHFVCLAK